MVGNGLALDLHSHQPQLNPWHPANPLSWAVANPSFPSNLLMADLPAASAAIAQHSVGSPRSDFAVFDAFASGVKHDDLETVYCQIRHYLALAYSAYQAAADPWLTDPHWKAGLLLKVLAPELLGAVSYNYDLTLEGVLEICRVPLVRLGLVDEPRDGLAVFKPHGSIDYALADNVIAGQEPRYPLWLTAELNDFPLRRLARDALRVARYEADLVLPAERTRYQDFQWVRPGWRWLEKDGGNAQTVIFWGLSYWPCDRLELMKICDRTSKRAQCIVVNPAPDPSFMSMLHDYYQAPIRTVASAADLLLDLK